MVYFYIFGNVGLIYSSNHYYAFWLSFPISPFEVLYSNNIFQSDRPIDDNVFGQVADDLSFWVN